MVASMKPWAQKLAIGGPITGAVTADGPLITVIAAQPRPAAVVHAYLDLLHWILNEPQHGTHGVVELPAATNSQGLQALATLGAARLPTASLTVELRVGGVPVGLAAPDFSAAAKDRAKQLEKRESALAALNASVVAATASAQAEQLEKRSRQPMRHLASCKDASAASQRPALRSLPEPVESLWFGKVEGLIVCAFAKDGSKGGSDRSSQPK